MRNILGLIVGITLVILWHVLGYPWIGWLFTRIPPDAVSTPRVRTWRHGVETTGG